MTTVTERKPQAVRTEYLSQPVPVEMIEKDWQGYAWLMLSGEWLRIESMTNLWDIDSYDAGEKPFIRMHFRVMLESDCQVLLFQDLIGGCWYQEISLVSNSCPQPTPIFSA